MILLKGFPCWLWNLSFYRIQSPSQGTLQARNGKKIQPFLACREPALRVTMVLKCEKNPNNFCVEWGKMPWRVTQIGFSSCLRRWKSENIPEAPSVHIWHGFTYSSICRKANGQLNPRPFKSRESFGTNVSNSAWYFWKARSLCKKLFPGERRN